VKSYDLWSEAFIKVAADGITDFSVKLRDSVSFGEDRNAKRACNEPALRRVFYHKVQLAHGHSSWTDRKAQWQYRSLEAT
jgi:hypothetical protein